MTDMSKPIIAEIIEIVKESPAISSFKLKLKIQTLSPSGVAWNDYLREMDHF